MFARLQGLFGVERSECGSIFEFYSTFRCTSEACFAASLGLSVKFCWVPLLSSPPRSHVLRRVLPARPRRASASPRRTATAPASASGENMLRSFIFFVFWALICLCDVRNNLLSSGFFVKHAFFAMFCFLFFLSSLYDIQNVLFFFFWGLSKFSKVFEELGFLGHGMFLGGKVGSIFERTRFLVRF